MTRNAIVDALGVLKAGRIVDLRKLFKNPRCQAGWNKNVLFGFS